MKFRTTRTYLFSIFFAFSVFSPAYTHSANCALEVNMPYKTRNSPSVFYISSDCTKHPIRDPETYFSYFSSWSDVIVVTESQLSSIANNTLGFLPWGPKKRFDAGSILKSPSDNKVFILLYDRLHAFGSEEYFLENGYKWEWVEDTSSEAIAKYYRGIDLTGEYIPEGMVFKYIDSPEVYRIRKRSDGTFFKTHIPSFAELKNLGYRPDRIALLSRDRVIPDDVQSDDERRLLHIKQIQEALELYYVDHNDVYPIASVDLGNDAKCLNSSGFSSTVVSVSKGTCLNPYMGFIPKGPGPEEYYRYVSTGVGTTYTITAVLESGAGGFGPGTIIASPSGITQE